MQKMKKAVMISLVAVLLLLTVQTALAQFLGFDLATLIQQKSDALADARIQTTSVELDASKQQAITDATQYIDGYISDINQSIDTYATQETEVAKQQLSAKAQELEDLMEAQKQTAIESSKTKVKIKIDEELNKKLNELETALSIKIQEKFK